MGDFRLEKKSLLKKVKAIGIVLAPSMIIGAIVGAWPGYRLYEYAWKDAAFCTSCHVHDYASVGWQKSVHGDKTTCHDCHHQPLRAYIREAYVMATKQPKFPKDLHHTPMVPKNLCGACHLENPQDQSTLTGPMSLKDIAKIPKIDHSRLHEAHLRAETDLVEPSSLHPMQTDYIKKGEKRPIGCADCHGGPTNRGHHFGAVDFACIRCHEQPYQHSERVKEVGCRSCHFSDFLAPIGGLLEEKE